ncbi:MAG TPA: sulfatase-like hydrolase/transferase [Terriglobales bacterium]|nr:sulfatase-like hydrolase/transferase [Terriglobales bacterium]
MQLPLLTSLRRWCLLASIWLVLLVELGFAAAPPNVVLITLDTVRADHIGAYGYKAAHTPNIDRVAAEGVRFGRAYTPVPITLPAHAVLMTGTYPMRSGMHDFSGNRLNPEQPTLASLLRKQGYATGAVVGAAVLDGRFGLDSGFDFYYDEFDFNRLLETNLDAMERPGNVVVDRGLEWLKQQKPPFFLWLHLYDAHHPYQPPSPYKEQFQANPYDGEIAFMDEQVGRVLAALRERKLYDNTLLVLVGDHGEGLGEHGEKTHGFFIYNSTLHVPLIIKPAAVQAARKKVIAQTTSLVDLLPTILEALGQPVPTGIQGRSQAAALKGEPPGADDLYAESFLPKLHFNWSELRAIQSGRYRFIDAPKPELYDLAKDPGETKNLAAERKAVSEELRARLKSLIAKHTPDKELAQKTGLDPALAQRLQALGYAAFSGGGESGRTQASVDPKDRIVLYELFAEAMSDSQHGRYTESIEKLKRGMQVEPDSVPIRYLQGLNYYRTRDYTQAAAQLRRVLELSPDYALAVYHLGLSYAQAGDFAQAAQQLTRALELDPTNFSAAFNLGVAQMRLGNMAESLNFFRSSVKINPGYAEGHRALGEMLLFLGKTDEALPELREAVRLAPDDPNARKSLVKGLRATGLDAEAQEVMRNPGGGRPE